MKAIYPGTFDPLTNGHLDQIFRAAALFETLIVGVAKSGAKTPLFTLEERVELAQQSLSELKNVEVIAFEGLLIDLTQKLNANVIVRGVRSIADFEYEAQMAAMNKQMNTTIETVFLASDQALSCVSSTLVRDIARHGGVVSQFVPELVDTAILNKLK